MGSDVAPLGRRGGCCPSVHLWLLAVGQLTPLPRLQGQRGHLLLHRLAAVGTVFLQLCKASPDAISD